MQCKGSRRLSCWMNYMPVLTFTRQFVNTQSVAWMTAAHKTPQCIVTGVLAGSLLTGSAAFIHICTTQTEHYRLTAQLGQLKLVAV